MGKEGFWVALARTPAVVLSSGNKGSSGKRLALFDKNRLACEHRRESADFFPMIKLKSLNKKLRKLEACLQKDAKKLAKLQRRVETALRAESVFRPATPAALLANKKRALTPEGREKLSALMKARWAAKRAGQAPAGEPQRAAA